MSAPTTPPSPRSPVAPPEPGAGPSDPSPARTTAKAWVIVAAVVLGLTTVAMMVAVLARGEDPPAEQARQIGPRDVSAPLEGRTEATFELVGGAEDIHVRSEDIGDDLYRIDTPDDGALVPTVDTNGTTVRVDLQETGDDGLATVDIKLSVKVRWQLRLSGGGTHETINFAGGRLGGIEFTAGASRIDVTLPKAEGTVRLRLATGAGQFNVHAPNGQLAQVRIGNGAGTVTVDGQARSGVSGGTVLTPPGWAQATDRYDIEMVGGVATFTVDRR